MRPVTFTMGPYAVASANAICLSQTPAAAGPLIINGAWASAGVATLDVARNALITTTADERARTFTIEGRDSRGDPIAEVVQGVNAGTVATVDNFLTITAVRISGPAAGAITVGTAALVTSPWIRLDDFVSSVVSYSILVNGGVNYTVQQTFDDPNSPSNPVPVGMVNWQPSSVIALVGATASQQGAYPISPLYLRVLFNSGAGSLTCSFLQPGAPP
jgi:hypothetical protein